MQTVVPLEPGQYYHIYNRGVNRTNIFIEDRNYAYFMRLYAKHITPVAETYAYCLLRNHFHLLVRIRPHRVASDTGLAVSALNRREVSHAFNNLLNGYAKAINKAYQRTGALFQHHFGRIPVTTDRYFLALTHYIHYNPQKHGFVADFREWPYSSYSALLSEVPTRLQRAAVLEWFGGPHGLRQFHAAPADERPIAHLIGEDD